MNQSLVDHIRPANSPFEMSLVTTPTITVNKIKSYNRNRQTSSFLLGLHYESTRHQPGIRELDQVAAGYRLRVELIQLRRRWTDEVHKSVSFQDIGGRRHPRRSEPRGPLAKLLDSVEITLFSSIIEGALFSMLHIKCYRAYWA